MKIKLLLGAAFFLLFVFSVNAQKHVKHPHAKKKVVHHKKKQAAIANHKSNMASATKFLRRTNKVIIAAHNSVNKGNVKKGNLAKAVHHQRYAKKLLKKHKAHRAVQHSRVARKYAMLAIRQNKDKIESSWNVNSEEKNVLGTTISDVELEKDIKADNPNIMYDDSKVSEKDMTEIEVIEMDPSDYKNE